MEIPQDTDIKTLDYTMDTDTEGRYTVDVAEWARVDTCEHVHT